MANTQEHHLLSTKIVNHGIEPSSPDAGSMTFFVRVRRQLPDFVQSVKLKYVKLGYHYLINHGMYLAIVPVVFLLFGAEARRFDREALLGMISNSTGVYDHVTLLAYFVISTFALTFYFFSCSPSIYLIDFACFKPEDDLKVDSFSFINIFSVS